MTLTTRKTKYSKNIRKPRLLLILHLQAAMDMMTNSSMRKRRTMAQNRPLLLTSTGLKSLIMLKISQGNGRLEGGQRHRKDNREELGFLGTFLFKNEWLVFIGRLTPQWCQRCWSPLSWTQPCHRGPFELQSHWWSSQELKCQLLILSNPWFLLWSRKFLQPKMNNIPTQIFSSFQPHKT